MKDAKPIIEKMYRRLECMDKTVATKGDVVVEGWGASFDIGYEFILLDLCAPEDKMKFLEHVAQAMYLGMLWRMDRWKMRIESCLLHT